MTKQEPYFRFVLKGELERRYEVNSQYSLRAYAKSLNVSPSALSEIMSGKKALSINMAERILQSIDLEPKNREAFLHSVVEFQKKRPLKRRDPKVQAFGTVKPALSDLSLEYYKYISEWHYVTILELIGTEGFKNSPTWIGKELGVSTMEAKIALERLEELGFIKKKSGKYAKVDQHLRLKDMYTATSAARKKKQKQLRSKCIEAIDDQPIEKRSATSLTLAIDPELLPEAKKRIAAFTEELCELFETGKKKKVYCLEVGLFSLQKLD